MLNFRTRRGVVKLFQRAAKPTWICPKCASRRTYATPSTESPDLPVFGEQLYGFTHKRTQIFPELQLTALHLHHDKTGAEYLHVARDDKNNVFSIAFKTNPPDNTGVPHILEHTTLCGSQKYPVRDPFFKMLPRSLSNFMNAFTSSDHTSYPFASTNRQDFDNLMSVYLDATLHPLLKETDFAQEGWRIGPKNAEVAASSKATLTAEEPLVFKGVVYNEMKGQMSDAGYLYYIKFQEQIFPAINNSGGDPSRMTDLTYDDLKKFHAQHYHPSNAKIFTYGDMPFREHLQKIGRELEAFGTIDADHAIKLPISIEEPIEVVVKGPIDPLVDSKMQYTTSTSWIMGDTTDIVESFSLSIMASLLLDGYGSPLYKALIESGIGPDWSPNTGYDSSGKIGIFGVGLNGVKKDDVPLVKRAINKAVQEVKDGGFEKSKVEGILHQLELSLKHKTANFGMGLMQRLQPGWFNGVDPFDALAWDKTLSAFKQKFSNPGYLEGLVEKYLLNDRTLTLTMEPSKTYGEDLAVDEFKRLSSKIANIEERSGSGATAREQLTARELELLKVQESARYQNLDSLPMVHVVDIPRARERKRTRDSTTGDVKIQWREANTNGLTYFRVLHGLDGLPEELRLLVPLFCDSILRLGTKDMNVGKLEDLIKLKTGGLGASYFSTTSPTDIHLASEGLSFAGYSLDSNVSELCRILRLIVLETNFDGPKAENMIRQLLQSDAAGALGAIANSGHAYARRYAEAGLTQTGLLTEQVSGLTQARNVATLAARKVDEGLGDVITSLKLIQSFAISKSDNLRVAITCGADSVSDNEAEIQTLLSSLPQKKIPLKGELLKPASSRTLKTFFPLPYQVYYSSLSVPTVPYNHSSGAPLQILAQLLTHKHLHHEIREKGGAYGGGAYAKGLDGIFGFYSYRDPNPQNTMKIMRDAGRWARDKQWSSEDLEEAKLSMFQRIDAPESVSEEGMTRFLSGVDEDMEQVKREQLLDVKISDVQDAAQKYLIERAGEGRLAVLGEKGGWVAESDGWEIKQINV